MECLNKECLTRFTCLVYPANTITKGENIKPPNQTLQPDLSKKRARRLQKLNLNTEIEANNEQQHTAKA